MNKEIMEKLKFIFPECQVNEVFKEKGFMAKSINEYMPNNEKNQKQKQTQTQRQTQQTTTNNYSQNETKTNTTQNFTKTSTNYDAKTTTTTTTETRTTKTTSTSSQNGVETPSYSNQNNYSESKTNKNNLNQKNTNNNNVNNQKDTNNNSLNNQKNSTEMAFDVLRNSLSEYWVGSNQDINALSKAFERPYISGFTNKKPKNSIMLLGTESRGRSYAIESIAYILKLEEIFFYDGVSKIEIERYDTDSENQLFLSDLYNALNKSEEVVIFEEIDKATLPQLEILYELISNGEYNLKNRYMLNNGALVNATGVLSENLISKISANGKYFVFTSTQNKGKIVSTLGNKFIKEIGDVIELDPITEEQTKYLAISLCNNLVKKCRRNLIIEVKFTDSLTNALSFKYSISKGVKGLQNFIDDNLYEPLCEMKLDDVIFTNEIITLSFEEEYCAILPNKEVVNLSKYLKTFNELELVEAKNELDKVIGLDKVKDYVLKLENNYKIQQMREVKGLKTADVSMHMIFVGNPGTGKTTIARIVAKYLKAIGVLSSGHLVEVTRSDLVGQYVGHTATKTTSVIKSAHGGVLFIDEAYSLCRDKNDTFGLESIDALVKGIEDNRDDLVVILAGYEDEMQQFLKTNSGLKSRFPNLVTFEDYTIDEMYEIAVVTANSKGYILDENAKEGLINTFEKNQIKGKNDSGNGRLVRNIIEEAIVAQSNRVMENPDCNLEILDKSDFGFDEIVEFDLEQSLQSVIGLDEVKDFIRTQSTMLKANTARKNANLKVDTTQSLNMIFSGNPGTGKTTMARIVAEMFHSMGILKSGHLVEVDKSDLVAEYVGQTATKTTEVFKSALGGVLFIDEAYSITNDGNSFGQECIDTLVKLIEDYRGEIVVILAGYTKEMKEFLKSNSGLESRFPLFIEFKDYSAEELYQIGLIMIKSRGFVLTEESDKAFKNEIVDQKRYSTANSGNGRMVRNIIDGIVRNQSVRVISDNVDSDKMNVIEPIDIVGENKLELFDLEGELSNIIGLSSVKDFVRTQYKMCLATEKRRKADVKVDTTQSLNMIFAGNPGTGKTTIARVVANMFKSMGVLKKGQLVEVDKTDLISGYVGQTATKTTEVFKSALGGVLFIDEAYSITNDGNSFGQECIDTLVKLIEDHKGDIIVILAGYTNEMREFMKSNSGLESRFPLRIDFPDYSANEMYEIGKMMISGRGFSITDSADTIFFEEITKLKRRSNASSGNGRMVRNFVEDIIRKQSSRIAESDVEHIELTNIIANDVKTEIDDSNNYDLDAELNKVIGLEPVKKYIQSLNARLIMQSERKKAGLKTDNTQTMHMIFTGNPGTGKTMMARTVANVLYNMNVINKNKLVETDRSGLVGAYVGHTAIKTREVIESALDGVLFIDEAYSLSQGSENDFGQESIDTIVKMMDDYRDRLVVILAGYTEDMKKFVASNAGLQSRFANIIEFPDYTTDELMQIADGFYSSQGYEVTDEGKKMLRENFSNARLNKEFGNGRYVRNVFEKSLNNQALRLSGEGTFTTQSLTVITEEDIRGV